MLKPTLTGLFIYHKEMKIAEERRLHFVSRTLLKNFSPDAQNGMIYVLSKPDEEKFISIKLAASEMDYNVLNINGEKSFELENFLSELESHIGRILKKVNENNFMLTKEEWEHLLLYSAILFCNSPNSRDKINRTQKQIADYTLKMLGTNIPQLEKLLNKVYEEKPHLKKVDINEYAKKLRIEGAKNITLTRDSLIYKGLETVFHTYSILSKMHWAFYKLKDESLFVTSDIPIIPLNNDQSLRFCLGFEYASLVQFPLTKKVCLIGNWLGPDSNKEVDGGYANSVNALTLKWAFNEVYSPLSFTDLNNQFKKFG